MIWYGLYHWYLRPSKRQRGLFLLTWRVLWAFLTIYICKNIFTSNGDGDLWCCIVWPSFLFDFFVKIWVTCKNILRRWFTGPCTPQPLSKKIRVRLCWKGIQDAFLVLGVQISFRSQFEISVKDRLRPKGHYLALTIGSWPWRVYVPLNSREWFPGPWVLRHTILLFSVLRRVSFLDWKFKRVCSFVMSGQHPCYQQIYFCFLFISFHSLFHLHLIMWWHVLPETSCFLPLNLFIKIDTLKTFFILYAKRWVRVIEWGVSS